MSTQREQAQGRLWKAKSEAPRRDAPTIPGTVYRDDAQAQAQTPQGHARGRSEPMNMPGADQEEWEREVPAELFDGYFQRDVDFYKAAACQSDFTWDGPAVTENDNELGMLE
jgi:hypothetical protein